MNPFSRMLERLYAKGCQSRSNHHRLVTICWLHGEGVSPEWLLRAAFDAFRPGDDVHPAQLARWWAKGRLEVQRLQLWTGGEPDERGVYSWQAATAKTLVHHYALATPFGPVRFAGALERATDPQLAKTPELESVVRMGDPRDPALYGPGGAVPTQALGLVSDVDGRQSWRFSLEGKRVRVEHLSEGRRLARDAALFALLGPAAAWFFRLLHDLEMRRGLRSLPGFLMTMLSDNLGQSTLTADGPASRTITLVFERPRSLAWLDRPVGPKR